MQSSRLPAAALLVFALLAGRAYAQATPVAAEAATPAGPAASTDQASTETGLQEVIVTSTRRTSDIQDVPATVEAVDPASLKALDITSVLQLPAVIPGLIVVPAGGNNVFLRGIGSASTGYNEAQVPVYIDGIYLANPAMGIYSFNDIDRIEVLKGPQGTLYGRNSTGGLISVTTHDPDATPRFDITAGYGNYRTWTGTLYGSTPITDTLAANVAVFSSKQEEGWGRNIFTGDESQRGDETGVESKLRWQPNPGTKITASFIFDTNNRDYGYGYQVYPGTVGNDGTRFLGNYIVSDRINPSSPFTAYIGSLKVEQDVNFATLVSLTAFQNSHEVTLFPGGSPTPGLPIAGLSTAIDSFAEKNSTWSQEFTFTSKPLIPRLDWVAGAFVYHDDSTLALSTWTTCVGNVCAPGFTPTTNTGYPTTRSYSGYADVTYKVFDATHATVGLRYTDETRGLTGLVTPLQGFPDSVATLPATTVLYPGQPYTGGAACVTLTNCANPNGIPTTLHFEKLTYRFVLQQDLTDNVHVYVSDNLGFKSGAFNANVFTNPPALPEVLHAYEGGLKSEFWNRRVRLNLSYFYYNYQDVQVRSIAPPAPPGNALLENAASERERGVDGDFSIAVTRDFIVNGGFEWLDAKYANFPGATCETIGTKTVTVNGVPTTVAATATCAPPICVSGNCNLAGYTVQFAAPVTASLGFVYNMETAQGLWSLTANDHYSARRPMDADDSIQDPPHQIVDASLHWTAPDKHLDGQLFVKNLTNQYTYTTGQEATSFAIVPGPPRTYGFTVGYHFH